MPVLIFLYTWEHVNIPFVSSFYVLLSQNDNNNNYWSEYCLISDTFPTILLSIEKSFDDKSKSFSQKDTFEGSRKVINAAMDRICEYTGENMDLCLILFFSCILNFSNHFIGLILNFQELKLSSVIWEFHLWTTYINPVSVAVGWMHL